MLLIAAACVGAPEAGEALRAEDIRELRWIAPGADRVRALTERPVECSGPYDLIVVSTAGGSYIPAENIGRLAFESPALLGGQAGRMGLSCSSCHLNGRGNPDFFMEGVSGAVGTADVTSSIFSKVRGNDAFDPKPIPDLAARDGNQTKDRTSPEFRTKMHGLIVEEFDGQNPPQEIFEAVLAYLDLLDIEECSPRDRSALSVGDDARDAVLALTAAEDFVGERQLPDALLMARVARTVLERMHERFVAADQADVREALVGASRAIEAWAAEVREGRGGEAPRAVVDAAGALARERAGKSLYNPAALRAALGE